MPTTDPAWTMLTFRGSSPAMPRTVSVVADEDQLDVGVCAGIVDDTRDDLGWAVVAAHRVERDADHRISARCRRCRC